MASARTQCTWHSQDAQACPALLQVQSARARVLPAPAGILPAPAPAAAPSAAPSAPRSGRLAVSRPAANGTVSRPAANRPVSRPAANGTVSRPAANRTVSRPAANGTVSRPVANSTEVANGTEVGARPAEVGGKRVAYFWYAGAFATELGVLGCAWAWQRRRKERGDGTGDQLPASDPGQETLGDQPLFGGAKESASPDQRASPGGEAAAEEPSASLRPNAGMESKRGSPTGKIRSALLDNARAIAVYFVIVQHCFGEIYFQQASSDLRTWLFGGGSAVTRIFWLAASVNMPVICVVSGICSQGPPTAKRVRDYFQYLVAPSLLWIGFFHTVLISLLKNQRFPEADLLGLANGEWYLSALVFWRAGSFLFFHRLHPLVLLLGSQIVSCAGGYVYFGPGWYWEFVRGSSALGFLPYYVLGYVLPFEEILDYLPEPSRLVRLGCLACVLVWAELWPSLLHYELYGPDPHKSYWEQHTTELSVFQWDPKLYWSRRLFRWGYEALQALVLLVLVLPRGETSWSWMGPHTLSVYLFHSVFLSWRSKFLVYFPPPLVQSSAGHVVVLAFILLLCYVAMVIFSSLSWRQPFNFLLKPTWLDPVAEGLVK